jgi:hypothetical protein
MFEFAIFLALVLGVAGWALHAALIVIAWQSGGPQWYAQGAYNYFNEGAWEMGVFFGLILFYLIVSVGYLRKSLRKRQSGFHVGHAARSGQIHGDDRRDLASAIPTPAQKVLDRLSTGEELATRNSIHKPPSVLDTTCISVDGRSPSSNPASPQSICKTLR